MDIYRPSQSFFCIYNEIVTFQLLTIEVQGYTREDTWKKGKKLIQAAAEKTILRWKFFLENI